MPAMTAPAAPAPQPAAQPPPQPPPEPPAAPEPPASEQVIDLPAADPEPTEDTPASAPVFTIEHDRDWTWINFSAKPDEDTRETLKDVFGARFSGRRVAWYITRRVDPEQILDAIG